MELVTIASEKGVVCSKNSLGLIELQLLVQLYPKLHQTLREVIIIKMNMFSYIYFVQFACAFRGLMPFHA